MRLDALDAKARLDGYGKIPVNGVSTQAENDQEALARLAHITRQKKFVSAVEVSEILRRAAALLCRTETDQCSVVHHLVDIPFTIFTKQSIKLGIALWLGVINENPRTEPRILTEIGQNWEASVHNSVGVFSGNLK